MDTKLKPCPFCGSRNVRQCPREYQRFITYIECDDCHANGPWATDGRWFIEKIRKAERLAVAAWNRRVEETK